MISGVHLEKYIEAFCDFDDDADFISRTHQSSLAQISLMESNIADFNHIWEFSPS